MRLSVVIVNWNSKDDLLACLESLARQTHPDLEIVVVDNGSQDGSVDAIRSAHPKVVLLAEQENLGFAEGCNRGIAVATGSWIALLNNDTIADERWAEALCSAAAEVPERCGMLQSLMLFINSPHLVNSTGIVLAPNGGGEDRDEWKHRPSSTALEEIFCPSGGAAAYRRDMLESIRLPTGYLDREFFCYFEDMDLGWRGRLSGWRAFFVPGSVVLHRYHGSTSRRSQAWHVTMTRPNRLVMLLKNASLPFLLRTLPVTAKHVAELAVLGEKGALGRLRRGVASGLAQRKAVAAMAVCDRRAVEADWMRRGPRAVG